MNRHVHGLYEKAGAADTAQHVNRPIKQAVIVPVALSD
jgi:hypothetical protein